MDISSQLVSRLMSDYRFKRVGEWLREGVCPNCGKKELYTHAQTPRVVKCGRLNKCGYEAHVKELYDDLFAEWSKHHKQTPQSPHAAADAYLQDGRGLNLDKIRGTYTQESYFDRDLGIGTATVRFALPNDGYWERLIDKPERFKSKANIKYGYSVKGQWWWHPANPKYPTQIWLAEGIFDACALAQKGLATVSPISCTNFPEVALDELRRLYRDNRRQLPELVFAYDNDAAGKREIKKAIAKASDMGFNCFAALPPYDKHRKLDWCDLLEMGLLMPQHLETYRYYGDLLTAETPVQAAVIRYLRSRHTQFYFEHGNRTFWFALDTEKLLKIMDLPKTENAADVVGQFMSNAVGDNEQQQMADFVRQTSTTTEILNARLEALYFQRNEVTDESWYFVRLTTDKGDRQATLTGDQLSSPAKLKPRLLSVFSGVLWAGNAKQLDIIIRRQMEGLKEVKTTDFIGYTKEHKAYIFNDLAFFKGKAVNKNDQDYYKIGRLEIKSLAVSPVLSINTEDTPDFSWWHNYHRVRGTYGTIVLAWWLGSYFAEQIRAIDRSFPFFELVGQAGAGKSRLLEFLWKLSGREDYEGFDPTKSTKAAVYREFAQIANLPVCLIEGDRNDSAGNATSRSFEWDNLKDAFNGRSIRSRGNKNNGNDTYAPPFRAAIMISQNEDIQASEAMLTRIVHVRLTRDGQTLETKKVVDELDRIPVSVASTFMAHALKNEEAILETYAKSVRAYEEGYHVSGITHTRIALNHAQLSALVDCLKEHVFGNLMTHDQAYNAQSQLLEMAAERVDRLSADHPDVERFWSVFDYLNTIRVYTNHKPVYDEQIALNLNHFYRAAKENYQDLPDITIMKRLLKSSSRYRFLDSNVTVRSNHKDFKNIKCWLFRNPSPAPKP